MTRRCPICSAPVQWEGNPDRPFCSERCRTIDLGHWASEDYAVPGTAVDPDAYEERVHRDQDRDDES